MTTTPSDAAQPPQATSSLSASSVQELLLNWEIRHATEFGREQGFKEVGDPRERECRAAATAIARCMKELRAKLSIAHNQSLKSRVLALLKETSTTYGTSSRLWAENGSSEVAAAKAEAANLCVILQDVVERMPE